MPSEIGLSSDGSETPADLRTMVAIAEQGGASTLWLASHLFQREPIATAALALAATRNISIALMAMSPYSVHPLYATMAAATLDEHFPGRVKLCFGVGAPRDLEAAGLAAERPLRTLREAIAVARALLSGETCEFKGERFSLSGRRLAAVTREGEVTVWDVETRELVASWKAGFVAEQVAWIGEGERLAVGRRDVLRVTSADGSDGVTVTALRSPTGVSLLVEHEAPR